MCGSLESAIEAQEEVGGATKGAIMLAKNAVKDIKKLSEKIDSNVEFNKKEFELLNRRHETLASEMKEVKEAINSVRGYVEDASKYRLVSEIFKALFGSTKKTVCTLVFVSVIFGLVNLKDILEIVNKLI